MTSSNFELVLSLLVEEAVKVCSFRVAWLLLVLVLQVVKVLLLLLIGFNDDDEEFVLLALIKEVDSRSVRHSLTAAVDTGAGVVMGVGGMPISFSFGII